MPKRKRGPTRSYIPASRTCKLVASEQSGSVPLKHRPVADDSQPSRSRCGDSTGADPELASPNLTGSNDFVDEDLRVSRRGRLIGLSGSKSSVRKLCHAMQRTTGTMSTAPKMLLADNSGKYPETWAHDCWWCCHKFDTRPVGVPSRYNKIKKEYSLMGFFCSLNCAKAWSNVHTPRHMRGRVNMRFVTMYRDMTAKDRGADKRPLKDCLFEAAPNYTVLQRFGGSMDIAAFRSHHCQDTRIHCVPQLVHFVPFGFNVFEIPRDKTKNFAPNRAPKYRRSATLGSSKKISKTNCGAATDAQKQWKIDSRRACGSRSTKKRAQSTASGAGRETRMTDDKLVARKSKKRRVSAKRNSVAAGANTGNAGRPGPDGLYMRRPPKPAATKARACTTARAEHARTGSPGSVCDAGRDRPPTLAKNAPSSGKPTIFDMMKIKFR